jgi:hypothetical protein
MPRSRTYTSEGFLEVQWYSHGDLICLVSGKQTTSPGDCVTKTETVMHQFTLEDSEDLRQFAKALRRAMRQAHVKRPAHRLPCVDGSVCGEPSHCPPVDNRV